MSIQWNKYRDKFRLTFHDYEIALEKKIWNEAIEAAAKLADYPDTAAQIRKLKK